MATVLAILGILVAEIVLAAWWIIKGVDDEE